LGRSLDRFNCARGENGSDVYCPELF
jgi:hypothetical protein